MMLMITTTCIAMMISSGIAHASQPTHTIKKQDTFWKLSLFYKVSLDSMLQANADVDPLNLMEGMEINLPSTNKKHVTNSIDSATAIDSEIVDASSGKSYSYSEKLLVKATAYTAAASENGKWGAVDYFGNKLKVGIVAVDPKKIPLGTKLYITGYGYHGLPAGGMLAVASDTGGAIKGNRIDIFVPGQTSQAKSFGIQDVQVFILKQ